MILEITFDKLFTPVGNTGFGYCPWNGKLAVVTNANGTTTSYAYDVMDRVTNITWTTADGSRIGGFLYVYDAVGRIVLRAHDIGTNTFNRSYVYDAMDRLASDGNVSYAYDAADNRIAKTGDVEGDISYTLGPGNRLQSWTGGSYTYNDAGCVTRIERVGKPTLDLTWDSQYQLISVATNGVFAEGYAYDALGRRVATMTSEGTVRHIYDNNWQCIADMDVNGNVLCSYVWGDGIDNLLAVRIGDETYTALTDVQGTVWGFTDGNGEVVARWTYDAWGNVLASNVSVPALVSLRYRFQGREWSAVTGLTNFRMRWYDTGTGRWLSKDPIGLNGGINLYVFCVNCPVLFMDPKGRNIYYTSENGGHSMLWVGDGKSVKGTTVFEFGPKTDNVFWGDSVIIVGNGTPKLPEIELPSTEDQDRRMIGVMRQIEKRKPKYSFFRYNCADAAREVLREGFPDMPHRYIDTPEKLLNDLKLLMRIK